MSIKEVGSRPGEGYYIDDSSSSSDDESDDQKNRYARHVKVNSTPQGFPLERVRASDETDPLKKKIRDAVDPILSNPSLQNETDTFIDGSSKYIRHKEDPNETKMEEVIDGDVLDIPEEGSNEPKDEIVRIEKKKAWSFWDLFR